MTLLKRLLNLLTGSPEPPAINKEDRLNYLLYLLDKPAPEKLVYSVKRAMTQYVTLYAPTPSDLVKRFQVTYAVLKKEDTVPDSWKARDRYDVTIKLDDYLCVQADNKQFVSVITPEQWRTMIEPITRKVVAKILSIENKEARVYYTEWYMDLFNDVITVLETMETCLVKPQY